VTCKISEVVVRREKGDDELKEQEAEEVVLVYSSTAVSSSY
jgi:hypothetical protein